MAEELGCALIRDELPEFALGVLSGPGREIVIDHLSNCSACSAEAEAMVRATDLLFRLAPEADPPPGFEVRLLERHEQSLRSRAARNRRDGRRVRTVLAATAAALALLAGVGIGMLVSGTGPSRSGAVAMRSAELASDGHDVGNVVVESGHPAWLFMTVDYGSWSGRVSCIVTMRGGSRMSVGSFMILDGYGGWAAPLPVPARMVTGARLEAASGKPLAHASLNT